jgi:anti-anti-sigma regulatory factor
LLRITLERSETPVRLRLEGRLTGPWVQELEHCWTDVLGEHGRGAVLDLADVTFIGEDGRALLVKLYGQGAVFHATDCLTRSIVETITGIGPIQGCSN